MKLGGIVIIFMQGSAEWEYVICYGSGTIINRDIETNSASTDTSDTSSTESGQSETESAAETESAGETESQTDSSTATQN